MELHWISTAASVLDRDDARLDDGGRLTRSRVEAAIAQLEWATPDSVLPLLSSRAIAEVIGDLRLPGVTRVAVSDAMAPYGVYGIEATYASAGRLRLFVLDSGASVQPLCTSLTPWRTGYAPRCAPVMTRDGARFRVLGAIPQRAGEHDAPALTYRVVFDDGVEVDAAPCEVLDLADDGDA